jgi:hypothetical protein
VLAACGQVRLGDTVSLAAPVEDWATLDNPDPAQHQMKEPLGADAGPGLSFSMDRIAMNIHGNADTHIDALCHVIFDGQLYHGVPAEWPVCMATSATPGSLSRLIMSPITRISGWPGMVRFLSTHRRPARSCSAPVALATSAASAGCLDARGPQDGAHLVPGDGAVVVLDLDTLQVRFGDDRPHVHLDPQLHKVAGGHGGQLGAEHRQRGLAAVEQQDPGFVGLDMPVLLAQRLGGHFPDLPGQFDAGRPGPHQGEGEPAQAFGPVVGGLGHLERAEYPPPDPQGVLDGFHPGCEGGVLAVPEIGLPDAGRQDEVVIAELHLLTQRVAGQHPPLLGVEAGDLGQDELDIPELMEQFAQGEGDLALGQDAGGALVEQRREQVMLSRSSRVTWTGAFRIARAANSPASPPPTITT